MTKKEGHLTCTCARPSELRAASAAHAKYAAPKPAVSGAIAAYVIEMTKASWSHASGTPYAAGPGLSSASTASDGAPVCSSRKRFTRITTNDTTRVSPFSALAVRSVR